jgi:VCBS repeat-containing protein
VNILGANTTPTATTTLAAPDIATGLVAGTVLGTDADGDTLTYTDSGAPSSGTLQLNPDGSFTYTPTEEARAAASSDSTDTFSVTIRDGHGGIVEVPVTVTVVPAASQPSPGTPPVGCPTNCEGATVTFTGGTAYGPEGARTTDGSAVFRDVDYYEENGFVFDYVGGTGGDVGNYYRTGNDVIHAHWGIGEMTSIEIRKADGGVFDFDYFVLTSNTLSPGGPATGEELVFVQGFRNGAATGAPVELTPEDWGFPASSVFPGDEFNAVDTVVFTSNNATFSCFGMDSFYINVPTEQQN